MAKVPRSRPGGGQLQPAVEPIRIGPTTSPPTESRTAEVPQSTPPRTPDGEGPRYLQMARMDARLRPDQVEELSRLRRRLAGRRQYRGERLTENTLLRVAVDLLLTHADQLAGDTEDELRDSVLPDSGTSEVRESGT
ncbi:hypothetical protein GCM10012275_64360 [Longimycelium tulufanense]|uniref:Uncharacterized protein n=1 Tax=Longimycelium tulufanense TaxID=907463 RepID=A0A8J3CJ87_9PSEU|nr:hypothetical protein [Longimycelium tulufanense]GGM84761.1 hypothetical protein GCM10012275_64360 [Longimycelium tulufanense]